LRARSLAALTLSLLLAAPAVAQQEDPAAPPAEEPAPSPEPTPDASEEPDSAASDDDGASTPDSGSSTAGEGAAGSGGGAERAAPERTGRTTNTGSPTSGGRPPPRTTSASAPQPTYVVRTGRGGDDDEDEEEEEEDEDPYDILWIELFGGFSWVDLRAIDTDNFYPEFVRLSGTGPAGGLAAGFRIEFVSVGLRGSLAHYGDGFEVGTAVAEVSLAIPIPVVKPFIRAGFGFGWHGDSNAESAMIPMDAQTTVFGWAFNAAVGLDVYLAHWFAIGAAFNVDILNMSRQSFDEPAGNPGDVVFEETGDAVGAQARGQLSVSFHL
jgi:hypothetical protein